MAATRAQKMRLGIFLVITTAIVIATLIYLVGASILEVRDPYIVVLQGGSAGLEIGSQVRFNDIVVGRVEHVRLDPEDPGQVIISISLEHGTPVTEDTIAVPEMANITGTKRLAMRGGDKNSKRLNPGDTIKSSTDDLSMLATKVVNIANKLEHILENLVTVTNPENMNKIEQVIGEVESITSNINTMISDNQENFNAIISDARNVIAKADSSMDKITHMLATTESAIQTVASPHNVKQIATILDTAHTLVTNVTSRTSDEELGQTIQSANRLVADTNVTVLRLRTDLQRVMRELETSVENINEFTQILVENPSVLISGRNEKERRLP
ncbi:MAG: MCE family protein [Proteobacteria bacterium]|nr:MCE family protein [Pseudomonadota bacterium]